MKRTLNRAKKLIKTCEITTCVSRNWPPWLFKVNVQIWKMFLGSLKFEYVLGMPDIPYTYFGGKE